MLQDNPQPSVVTIVLTKSSCTTSSNTLQCLREVPFSTIYTAANLGLEWFATIDGTFIKEYPQISYTEGRFAKVPILHGTNTDEGVSFGTTGVNTDAEAIQQLTGEHPLPPLNLQTIFNMILM